MLPNDNIEHIFEVILPLIWVPCYSLQTWGFQPNKEEQELPLSSNLMCRQPNLNGARFSFCLEYNGRFYSLFSTRSI